MSVKEKVESSRRQKKRKQYMGGEMLTDETYYHGFLMREDAEQLLVVDGDFLVRSAQPGMQKNLISARVNGVYKHIVIKETSQASVYIELYEFEDIPKLIRFYVERKMPLNAKTGVILLTPVPRQDWELLHDQIKLAKKMGEGAFGAVYRGELRLSTKDITAVAVKLHHFAEQQENIARQQMNEIMGEARLMRQYKHRNVVRFYGVAAKEEPLMIVMELVRGGGLDSFLQKHAAKLENFDRVSFALDAARGLEYLHHKNCLHRDIAARNCLISHEYHVKISDFGLSQEVQGIFKQQDGKKVPVRWLAPEVFKSMEYSEKTDVFSYGILLWEIYSDGAFPYEGMTAAAVRKEVTAGYRMDLPPVMSKHVRELARSCWHMDPDERPPFHEARRQLEQLFNDQEQQLDKKNKGFVANRIRKKKQGKIIKEIELAPEPDFCIEKRSRYM